MNRHQFICLATFFASALDVSNAIPHWFQGKLQYDVPSKAEGPRDDPTEFFFTQRLDHFDRLSEKTFDQRYFLNDTFWSGAADAPVFLCVGGEGPPLDASVLVSSVHCNDMVELAPKHGALMVALEHRYYGKSNPFGADLATENLKWLNSEQALEDIASFHTLISSKYSLQPSNRWITWGGSYPGMMAALARYRFPQLIFGSISSSAPLQPALVMQGYNDVVAESMAAEDVGGSDKCLAVIVDGHAEIGEKLQSDDGRRELEDMFNICSPKALDDVKNREAFAGDGVVYLPVQSNDPACTSANCNIGSICAGLLTEDGLSPVEKLAKLSAAQQGGACTPASYDSMISSVARSRNPERTWLFQTCTEWGFYQTCDVGTKCPYTQGLHTIDVDFDICSAAFGLSPETVQSQIADTEARYGGDNIQGSRIFFVNGEIDPWHANSVLESPNDLEPTHWVTAASHHFWTHPSLPTDSQFVVNARELIWDQVGNWLKEEAY